MASGKRNLSPEALDERAQVITALIDQLDIIAEEKKTAYERYRNITEEIAQLDAQRKDVINKLAAHGAKLGA